MNVAIIGSSGYIASFIVNRLNQESVVEKILRIDKSIEADYYIDLQEANKFCYSILDSVDFVVFTAAISSPDKCASDFSYCWNINVTGTKKFITEALNRKCNVLFFSSDAVFGDVLGEVYTEESETHAETSYGRMKKEIEDSFKDYRNFKSIRLSYVTSAKDKFVTYCMECIRNKKEAEIYHPFYRNVISINDVVDVVVWFISHWYEYQWFVLNVAGKELVSRIRIADELNRILENRLKYRIMTPEDTFYENRPSITQMKSLYLYRYNIIEDCTFTEKIRSELTSLYDII